MFLLDFGREALYGGAAGGGKSIAILMAASQFLMVPGYAALLLRKSFRDLDRPLALMDIAEQWWRGRPGIRFDIQERAYYFDCPGGGHSRIVFGSLDEDNDRFKYQGGAYHFVGFDELTQHKERDYRYLFSRMRRVKSGPLSRIPIRMRSTANPGGIGHEWVYARFIAQWQKWRQGNAERPERNFHPAIIDDNPMLDKDDYVQSLNELDPVTRAQLLRGDWNIRPDGRMFKRDWFKPIRRSDLPGNCRWVRWWDMASTQPSRDKEPDFTVGAKVGRSPSGAYYIADIRRWRKEPAENETLIRHYANEDTRRVLQAMEQEPGASGKIVVHHYRTNVFDGTSFRAVPAAGRSSNGVATTVLQSARTPQAKIIAAAPVASQADAGNAYIVVDGSWDHEAFLAEIEIFPDTIHDDQVDAVSGAFSLLAKMHMTTLDFGQGNTEFETQNQWRPDANSNTVVEWLGRRVADARSMEEREVEERRQTERLIESLFAM